MNKKLVLRLFIEIQKILFLKKMGSGLIEDSDEYETVHNSLTKKFGFDDEDANKLIGSYNLTLENNPEIEEFTSETDLNLIQIAKPKEYLVEFTEVYKVIEFTTAKIGLCYSEIEAEANYYQDYFDREDSEEIDRDFIDRDLGRIFTED